MGNEDISAVDAVDAARWFDQQRRDIRLYERDGGRVQLHGYGAGRSAFLACGGPSLAKMDLARLQQRGIVTMAVNNCPAVFAQQGLLMPNMWTCVDKPTHFIEQIWKDPAVMKFAPQGHYSAKLKVRTTTGELIDSAYRVNDCPATFYYNRSSRFDPGLYLTDVDFCWGNDNDITDKLGNKGGRSCMMVALKLLYYLGFKKVYVIGADFKMEPGRQNYAFEQERTHGSIKGNNATYAAMNTRFEALAMYFNRAQFQVINCTPNSGLTAFPVFDFAQATDLVRSEVMAKPIDTKGHYEL